MKRLGRISALVLSLMLVLTACGSSSTGNSSGTAASSSGASSQRALKDTLTYALGNTVNKLDCGDQGLMVGHQVARALYDTLIFPGRQRWQKCTVSGKIMGAERPYDNDF